MNSITREKISQTITKEKIFQILRYILTAIILLLLLALDYTVILYVRTELPASKISDFIQTEGMRATIHAIAKAVLFLLGNAGVLYFLFRGEKFCAWLENKKLLWSIEWRILAFLPIFQYLAVQYIATGHSITDRIKKAYLNYIPKNLIMYYVLLISLLLILRRAYVAVNFYIFFLDVLALVNHFVMEFRGSAFKLTDIFAAGTAAEVTEGYQFTLDLKTALFVLTGLFLMSASRKLLKINIGPATWKARGIRFGIFAAMCVAAACLWSQFFTGKNPSLWRLNLDYRRRGFLYVLAKEVNYLYPDKPEGYSTEKATEYAEEAENEENLTAISDGASSDITPTNLIVIMNESLTDFEYSGNLLSDVEILPNIHSLDTNVKKGYLHMPVFGGGTATSEYEVLTGNSAQFQPAGSSAYQLYTKNPEYGLATTLAAQGYTTIAMHPNLATNWNRRTAYTNMQFGTFLNIDSWGEEISRIRRYCSDASAFERIEHLIEDKSSADEKTFVFCVTMQNHGSYTDANQGDVYFDSTVNLSYSTEYPRAETYLSLARESDSAFEGLIEYFSEVEEPTMIVMFGDHWPKLETEFYAELLGKDTSEMTYEEIQQRYVTPYVIWTNYPSETDTDGEIMSANYFGSYILEQAGLSMTSYNKFILETKEELPIIGIDAVQDKNGNWYQMSSLPEEYETLVNKYKTLEYNNVFDKSGRNDDIFTLSED